MVVKMEKKPLQEQQNLCKTAIHLEDYYYVHMVTFYSTSFVFEFLLKSLEEQIMNRDHYYCDVNGSSLLLHISTSRLFDLLSFSPFFIPFSMLCHKEI